MPNKNCIIGLEIHAELKTASKVFCSCLNNGFEKKPNFNTCPICTGHPGTLPTVNEEAVKAVIKTGLALHCDIARFSRFDRKNYFYPDIPKGYQISQNEFPFCQKGYLIINGKKIRIRRIHLEEDTGKLYHKKDYALIDFNRSGVPLMELVTEPDITSGKDAHLFAQELQNILRYLNVSDANMEKGQMRIEVNISLGSSNKLGTRVEIKNLNSFRSVEKAVDYEINRQEKEKVVQETRGWDEKKQKTVSQRKKEKEHDYRYFPEPDIPPIHLSEEFIQDIKQTKTELPEEKRKRFKKEYGLDEKNIEIFILNKDLASFFEKTIDKLKDHQKSELTNLVANYLITDLLGLLEGKSIQGILINPENFAKFIFLIKEKNISSNLAKIILKEMFKTGTDPSHIIEEKKLLDFGDQQLEQVLGKVITNNPQAVENYKNGKQEALKFLVGQVMKESQGKANPSQAKDELLKKI